MTNKSTDIFVGPRPYEEENAAVFFGREREARDLVSLVIANPLLLIYAPSGAGKTSLINARLIPMLGKVKDPTLIQLLGPGRGFEVLPTARVSGVVPQGIDLNSIAGANIYVFNALMSLVLPQAAAESGLTELNLAKRRLADYLDETRSAKNSGRVDDTEPLSPRILIFDQFEELFTSHLERWRDRENFFVQICDALRGGPISFREGDIRLPEALIERIARGDDPVSSSIRTRLSNEGPEALNSFSQANRNALTALVTELNNLIKGPSLYDEQTFAGVMLRSKTQALLQADRKSKNFTDLNCSLLEDAYPREIFHRVEGDPALRIVLSMREDYIAELDPYMHLLPDRFTTRYRLERLRRDAALAAVTGPMQFTRLGFGEGVAEQLVENLLKTPVRTVSEPQQTVTELTNRAEGTQT